MEVARGRGMYTSFVVDIKSWKHGALGTCFMTWIDGIAQGGAAVWCHGGIDGRNDRVYADIYHVDFSAVQWR
jgi:hypothetical protein